MEPNAGRGLHSFESFSFVIIALSRFISYHGRRKGKVGSPAGKTWRTSNRRNKKHKRSENYSRTHRFRRYHVEPFESCWANIGWKANFTCGIPRGDYKNMLSWSYQRGSWGSGWNPFEDSTDKGGNRHRTCSGKKMAGRLRLLRLHMVRQKLIIQRNIQPPKTQIKLLCHYNITNMPHQKIQVKFIRVNPDHHRVLHFKLISQQVKIADLHHAVPLINFLQFRLLNQVIVSLQPSHVYQS